MFYSQSPKYNRSTNYRVKFFAAHQDENFRCRYCHRKLTPQSLTVDHLIPVDKARKSFLVRLILRILHFDGVNDTRNLVPACAHCNRQKSNSLGLWLVRGFLGQYFAYWIVVWIVRVLLILACVGLCVYTMQGHTLSQLLGNFVF